MPYKIKKNKAGKWEIIRKTDGVVVGKSDSKKNAIGSMIHRLSGEKGK